LIFLVLANLELWPTGKRITSPSILSFRGIWSR